MRNIDKPVFFISIISIVGVSLLLFLYPAESRVLVSGIMNFLMNSFDSLYIVTHIVLLCFIGWLTFGRFGKVVLGDPDDTPQYSDFSWATMMFCTGIASSLLIFSFLEPIYYLTDTPFNIEPMSEQAYEFAHMYGQFHWGPSAWLFYTPGAIAIAYNMYVRKKPSARLGDIVELSRFGTPLVVRTVDIFTIFAILGGIGASLGLAAPLICRLISDIFHIPESQMLMNVVFLIWFSIFATSVWRGLDKGIKVLSNVNIGVAVAFILLIGVFAGVNNVISTQLHSTGLYLDNFFKMSFNTDPFAQSGFPQRWTVFYWGWWLSYLPIMGLFTAKISRGRTIRQVALGMVGYGTVGCVVSFSSLGCYALNLQHSGAVDLVSILATQGKEEAIIAILNSLPFPVIWSLVFVVLSIIFMATTIDSSAYVLASTTTKHLKANEQPSRGNRIIWAVIFAVFAMALTRIGGLETIQTASVLVGFPMIFILFMTLKATHQMLKFHDRKMTISKRSNLEVVDEA